VSKLLTHWDQFVCWV